MTKQNKVKFNGVVYDIDTSHHTALFIFEHLSSGKLDEYQQAYLLVKKMFGKHAPVDQKLVDLGAKLLSVTEQAKSNKKPETRDMDLVQDRKIYAPDILREYGIDIYKENIELKTLLNLLEGLSHKSRFVQVREIRNKDLSKIKDSKERKQYKELQEHYKLEDNTLSEVDKQIELKEQEKLDNFLNTFK